jgi:hypothetical protein
VNEATERIKKILDAKYEKADLNEVVLQNAGHLHEYKQQALKKVLLEFEDLFDNTLGH